MTPIRYWKCVWWRRSCMVVVLPGVIVLSMLLAAAEGIADVLKELPDAIRDVWRGAKGTGR